MSNSGKCSTIHPLSSSSSYHPQKPAQKIRHAVRHTVFKSVRHTNDKVKDVKFWVSLILTKRILQHYLNWHDTKKTHSKVLSIIHSWILEPELWKPNLKCVQHPSICMGESSFVTSKLQWLMLWKNKCILWSNDLRN